MPAQPHDLSRDDTLLEPWRDGSTALLVDPLELLERLAALVPSPRRPLLAYYGYWPRMPAGARRS